MCVVTVSGWVGQKVLWCDIAFYKDSEPLLKENVRLFVTFESDFNFD
jgi:hypothetical protein